MLMGAASDGGPFALPAARRHPRTWLCLVELGAEGRYIGEVAGFSAAQRSQGGVQFPTGGMGPRARARERCPLLRAGQQIR